MIACIKIDYLMEVYLFYCSNLFYLSRYCHRNVFQHTISYQSTGEEPSLTVVFQSKGSKSNVMNTFPVNGFNASFSVRLTEGK
jgi:hypothetical protein